MPELVELDVLLEELELLDELELPAELELLLDEEEVLDPAGLPPHPTMHIVMNRTSGVMSMLFIGLAW